MRHTLAGRFFKRRHPWGGFLLAGSLWLLAGCANLPDARPFTDASLEKALTEIQPAIERIALIMSDQMQSLDDLARAACQAQRDELRISNQSKLGYRATLTASCEKLMDKIRAELDSGRKPSEITQVDELKL